MGIFGNKVIATTELRLEDIIPNYDKRMATIINIGKHLYRGYLPDSAIAFGDFSYLKGMHDYKVYTKLKNGTVKRRKTMQVPKFTTEYLTKLIYTEKVNSILESESEPKVAEELNEYLQEVLNDNDYWNNTASLTETMFNLGGKVEYPTIKNSKIKLEFVTAERFFPTDWDNKYVYSGVFVSYFNENGYYYTKLMWINKKGNDYEFKKELYKSKDKIKLGQKVSYSSKFEDKETFTLKNFTSIPFTYTKPRIKNNQVLNSPLGIPLWFNSLDIIADIDLIFDTKFREVRYGGRTKVVPSYTMRNKIFKNKDGNNEYTNIFDPDDPTFTALNFDPNSKQGIVDLTSPIREESFIKLLNNSLDMVGVMLGFNTGTFVFDGKSMKTATEIITEKQSTYQTKVNQERALEKGHINLFKSILELTLATGIDNRVTRIPDDLVINIQFDDSIIVDKEKELSDMQSDVNENRVPSWRLVAKRYKISEEEAKEWVAEAEAQDDMAGILGIDSIEDEPEE